MIKGQKGLSALVIVLIVAVVIIAVLLIITLGMSPSEPSGEETPAPTPEEANGETGGEVLHVEPVLIPIEDLSPEMVEWLDNTYPGFLDHYREGGIPIEMVWELERIMQ